MDDIKIVFENGFASISKQAILEHKNMEDAIEYMQELLPSIDVLKIREVVIDVWTINGKTIIDDDKRDDS